MLPKIIAQAMALVSVLLDKWVDASETVSVTGNCYDFAIYNVTMTACGMEQEIDIIQLIDNTLNWAVRLDVLWGLFVYNYHVSPLPPQPPPGL